MTDKKKDREIIKEILETALMEIKKSDMENWEIVYNLKRKLKINFSE